MELSKNSFRIVAVAGAFLLSSQIQAKAPSAVVSEQNNTQQSSQTTANTTSLDLNNAKKEKEVEGFVKNAADYIEKNGKDKAFAEFNKKQGLFTKGDSYILIIGYDQKVLVNPINPERINKIATFLDPDGDVLSEEMINLAKKVEDGWSIAG